MIHSTGKKLGRQNYIFVQRKGEKMWSRKVFGKIKRQKHNTRTVDILLQMRRDKEVNREWVKDR